MAAHAFNPSTREGKAGGSLSPRPARLFLKNKQTKRPGDKEHVVRRHYLPSNSPGTHEHLVCHTEPNCAENPKITGK
jgi:hypothetical protein